ncbi:MAG: recombinase family protein [Clostridia bacterium]|nr:recombinase family protein [Clostridia bacterium]
MKYVACYARVSTDEQARFGFSIQAQKDALEKYCKEKGYKYEFYIDEGISASSMKKRKALNEMLSKANVFDMILFTKLDRLSRNVLDANNINKLLIDNNCTMKAIDEDDVDTSTADGTFIFNLKVSLAQREIGKTSERIKFVFENKRQNGEVTSGTKKYGYNIINKKFEINQIESSNIVDLYEYCLKVNGNLTKTYEYFIIHFPGKGYDAMITYLHDTSYIGKYKLYRKNIYIDNYIPRIMNDDLFFSVQDLFKKREKTSIRTSNISLFSGLTYCNICKNRMFKKEDNRSSKKLIRYCCDNASRRKVGSMEYKCDNHKLVREEYLEKYLLDNISNLAKTYISKNSIKTFNAPKDNSKEIQQIENKICKLKDLYLDDLIDKNTYKNDYEKLSKKLNTLKNEIQTIDEKKDFTKIEKIVNLDINKIYCLLSIDEKRTFWLNIIDKIYIENGEIKEVTFL